jgi:hypothetical protein
MISIILGVKDRTERLAECLASWRRGYCSLLKEIIIVDWSSKIPIINNEKIIEQIERSNIKNNFFIKIARVENQIFYNRCQALNLARSLTNSNNPVLLKIDADYVSVNTDWLRSMPTINYNLTNYFVVSSSLFCDANYNGFLFVNKNHFDMVNGYNENLDSHWGYEDKDLENRLSNLEVENLNQFQNKSKLQKVIFYDIKNHIYHIPHDDNLRLQNIDTKLLNNIKQERTDYQQPFRKEQEIRWIDEDTLFLLKKLSEKQKEIAKTQTSWVKKKYQTLESSKNYVRLIME